MEPALALVHVNGITRTAVRLIKGMKLSLDEEHFVFSVFSVISWFKVTERYTLGEICQQRRRDLRRGELPTGQSVFVCFGCTAMTLLASLSGAL
jgi:hypothetical protein